MPDPFRTSVSAVMLGLPVATSTPPVPSEFKQPALPPTALLLPHGQAVPEPSPKQKPAPAGAPRSRTKTSCTAFVSLATRFVASAANPTNRPSAEIAWKLQRPLA